MFKQSPAQKFRERKLAKNQTPETERNQATANAYEKQLMQLAQDKAQLKAVQSLQKKAELKKTLVEKYFPWVEGTIESNAGNQDDVLITVMVWCLDAGLYEIALQIAAYAIAHKLVMPDQYKRNTATVVAEELAEASLRSADVPLELLERTLLGTMASDMPDEVRAKLHKAIGNEYCKLEKWQAAVERYNNALKLHPKTGCKKDLERAERELKKAGEPA